MPECEASAKTLRRLTEMVEENERMLDAIIKHLKVPNKSPVDFVKE